MSGVRISLPPLPDPWYRVSSSFALSEKTLQKGKQIDIRVAKFTGVAERLRLQQFCGKIQFPRIETHKNQAYKADSQVGIQRKDFKMRVTGGLKYEEPKGLW